MTPEYGAAWIFFSDVKEIPTANPCKIGIGGAVARSPLPHHRRCGSAYGGSVGYGGIIEESRKTESVKVSDR